MEKVKKIKATEEEKASVFASLRAEEIDLEIEIELLGRKIKELQGQKHSLEMAQLDLNGRRNEYWHATKNDLYE